MNTKNKILILIAYLSTSFNCFGQLCDAVQSPSSIQQTKIKILVNQLDAALAEENFSAIDSLNNLIKTTFGEEGGKPDAIETYYNLTSTAEWQDLTHSVSLSRKLIAADSLTYVNLWKLAKGMKPSLYQENSIFLRTSAEIALGLLKIADKETDLKRKTNYQSWATRALDSLATMQLPNGAFPFPDLRTYEGPVFSPIIQNYLNALGKDSTAVLSNGWIVDDRNTGEFKFDAGVIGNAYYEAYTYTGNIQYKNIALSVADYMMSLKMNTNYNYNTFVSLALTRAYQLTNDLKYLNRAIINLRYGVFPGQLENGRWCDGHNANSRYHNLMICNIAPTINLIPSENPHKVALEMMAVRAVENLINYSSQCGSTTGFRWLTSAYLLDSTLFSATTKNQIKDLIGRHINQAAINEKYLDVQSMGRYIELLTTLTTGIETTPPINLLPNSFPNPFTEQTNVAFDLFDNQTIALSIYDDMGKLIKVIDSSFKTEGTYNYTINGADLSKGTYLIILQTNHGSSGLKIIKE